MEIGLAIPREININEITDVAKACEDIGFNSIWSTESYSGDAFSLSSLISAKTNRINIGTSVVSIFTRSAPLIAMSARTVDAASGGRFILGLGTSHRSTVEQKHGMKYDRPFSRMRDYVSTIRALLSGQSFHDGETLSVNGFELQISSGRKQLPIYVAAVGQKMLRLANEMCDGAILYLIPPEIVSKRLQNMRGVRTQTYSSTNRFQVACLINWCMSDDRKAALRKSKQILAHYMRLPTYNKVMNEAGFARELEVMTKGRLAGESEQEIASSIPDSVAKLFCAVGTMEECKSRLEEFRAAGVTLPIIYPQPVDMDARLYLDTTMKAVIG